MMRMELFALGLGVVACAAPRAVLPDPTRPFTITPEAGEPVPPAPALLDPALAAPVVQRLDNGLTIISLERRAVPLVEIELGLSSAHDSGAEGTVAVFTAQLLRHLDPDLDAEGTEELDVDRISVSTRGTAFHVRALREEVASELESLSNVTRWPDIDSDAEEAARRELAAYRERRTTKDLRRDALRQLYGPESPRVLSVAGAKDADASVRSAREFHRLRYQPQTSVLSFVGALSAPEAKQLAQRYFGDWKPAGPPPPAPTVFTEMPPSGPIRASVRNNHEREAAMMVVAMPCVPLSDPEGLALDMAAMLLGRNQKSRVRTELRHRGGSSYGITARCAQTRESGTFLISLDTAPEKVGETLQTVLAAAKQLGIADASSEELSTARGHLLGAALRRSSSNGILSRALAGLYMDGQPLDDLARLPSRIQDLEASEVRAAASKYLDGTRVGVAVYGPAAVIVPQLKALGAITW